MKVAVFSAQQHDHEHLVPLMREAGMEPVMDERRLTPESVNDAAGADAVCAFTNDDLGAATLDGLHALGIRVIALRCSGHDNLDHEHAASLGMRAGRVPAYSPSAIAEHAVALLMTLNRHTHFAWQRTRRGDFRLNHLAGFDVAQRNVGVIGTGKIGAIFCRIMQGFGARVRAMDPYPDPELQAAGVTYTDLDGLLSESNVVCLMCPLTRDNRHLINADTLARMPRGAILINTARGPLVDTDALEAALDSGQLGAAALDVYEDEGPVFFRDWSGTEGGVPDERLVRLTQRDNVLVTGHQAFLTHEGLTGIAETTVRNLQVLSRDPEGHEELPGRLV
ncbi:D-lactate dehydrogenase [Thioalkalivibrio sp. ALE21]|uniref:2-hydroxyacid dehydrogenase n=1 Tax=Thioalkalivibrio sp. ALE21 TaxID=1158175 RepID=UPI000D9B050C|nr:2-hydroxyacid dehydrogenase [Thioalkalivibrio sp. ALE21]PYG03474.1 D-lactate dehydrogenase [Thioalkalivibrio sp. ALE21]